MTSRLLRVHFIPWDARLNHWAIKDLDCLFSRNVLSYLRALGWACKGLQMDWCIGKWIFCFKYSRPRALWTPPLPPPWDLLQTYISEKPWTLSFPNLIVCKKSVCAFGCGELLKISTPWKIAKFSFDHEKYQFWTSTYIQIMSVWIKSLPYDLGWHFSTKYS